jgi:hypothetical protein
MLRLQELKRRKYMSTISMVSNLSATGPHLLTRPTAEQPAKSPASLLDRVELGHHYNWKNIGAAAAGTVAGAGVGVYAGLATGTLAALAGVATGGVGGAVVGMLTSVILSRHLEPSTQVGVVIEGSLLGGAVGAIGGGLAGAMTANPVAALALGALGAVAGFGLTALSMASQDNPQHAAPRQTAQPPVGQ